MNWHERFLLLFEVPLTSPEHPDEHNIFQKKNEIIFAKNQKVHFEKNMVKLAMSAIHLTYSMVRSIVLIYSDTWKQYQFSKQDQLSCSVLNQSFFSYRLFLQSQVHHVFIMFIMSHVGHVYCAALTSNNSRELYTLCGTAVTWSLSECIALSQLCH